MEKVIKPAMDYLKQLKPYLWNGEYPKGTQSFIFNKGTVGNTHFLAIPFNSTNKEGAMAVIN